MSAQRGQQPLTSPPPIIRSARSQGSEAPPSPCQRCQGIPDKALTKLRAALEAKEAQT